MILAVASAGPYWGLVAGGAVVAGAAVALGRRRPGTVLAARRADAAMLVAVAVTYLVEAATGHVSARVGLPLALCNALVPIALLALLSEIRAATDITWYLGTPAAVLGLSTPDLVARFPSAVFFSYIGGHLGVLAAALLRSVGPGARPRWSRAPVVFAGLLAYALVTGLIDWATGANYLFLRSAPAEWTPLRLLGPWPYYVISATAVAAVVITVLALPWREPRVTLDDVRVARSWTALVVLGALTLTLFLIVPGVRARQEVLARIGGLLRRALGIRLVVEGAPPTRGPYVVCANHDSYVDGLVVLMSFPSLRPIVFVAGGELSRQFLAGTVLRRIGARFTSSAAGTRPLVRELVGLAGSGRSIAVFPAGGLGATSFRPGGFLVAGRAGCPVIPVRIDGSQTIVAPGSKRPHPGTVRVRVGEPLQPSGPGAADARALALVVERAVAELGRKTVSSPG